MSVTQVFRPAAIHTALPADTLVLRTFSGDEYLSRPFRYMAELASEDGELDFDLLIGHPACVRLATSRGGNRYFHGLVARFVQIPGDTVGARYQAEMVPWLWLLSRTSDCRIYQRKSAVEIVEEVFRLHGFADYELRLTRNYRAREYCVQYRETSFNFVSRLLEQEGITYFFRHEMDRHVLVLADSPAAFEPAEGYEEIAWLPPSEGSSVTQKIRHWIREKELQPVAYAHTDYNFETPRVNLTTAYHGDDGQARADLEIFDYPGEFAKGDEGEDYARVRLEELQVNRETIRGETDARGLSAGGTFRLTDYPRADQNRNYLVTSVHHRLDLAGYASGEAGGSGARLYDCTFAVVEAARPYRPPRITPKPVVHGEQTAVVVGPKGEEIHVDDHARVKVHFFWDRHGKRDETSSCWLRVSQPWAGKGYGGMNIPRTGCEVIVSFLEGDPDRPIITGRVYNAATMPHPSNAGRDGKPGNSKPSGIAEAAKMTSFKSESTPGGGGSNEITMNDTAGAEGLFIKAQKDETHIVGNDREDTVGNNETRKVGNDRARDVGNNETVKVGTNRSVTVGANHTETIGANQSIDVGANKTETIAVACTETVGMVMALSVGVGYQVTVGASMNTSVALTQTEQIGLIKHTVVGSKYTIEVGASSIVLESGGKITIKGTEFEFTSSGPVKINGSVIDLN